MAKGISIHIGVHHFDSSHYGYEGTLESCPKDAMDMQEIADSQNFESTLLLTEEATRDNVKNAIQEASEQLEEGDMLFLSYSGHGGTLPDENQDEGANDYADETWCLYDGQLLDDELLQLWSLFAEGVRVFVISDSCHSGTVTKAAPSPEEQAQSKAQIKAIPYSKARDIYIQNKSFYRKIAEETPMTMPKDINCTVKLFAGCQDTEFSYMFEGAENSTFTEKLNEVWDAGQFVGDTESFFTQIKEKVTGMNFGVDDGGNPRTQTPNLLTIGIQNEAFDTQRPFSIYLP